MTEHAETMENIECLLRQELAYHPPSVDEDPRSERFSHVGIESRGRMLSFFYELLGKIGSSRETAEIALSYLDRFLSTQLGSHALENKKLFQLVSTTCLYTAVKIHEVQAMTPKLLADLSQGAFTAEEVEEMELILAQTLRWRLNPPTSLAFIRQYLELLPSRIMNGEMKCTAYDLARHQTELALEDPRLFCEKKSMIAYIAVQNTLEQVDAPFDLSGTVGSVLFDAQPMSFYRYKNLQAVMQLRLTTQLGLPIPPSMSLPSSLSSGTRHGKGSSPILMPSLHCDMSPRAVNIYSKVA